MSQRIFMDAGSAVSFCPFHIPLFFTTQCRACVSISGCPSPDDAIVSVALALGTWVNSDFHVPFPRPLSLIIRCQGNSYTFVFLTAILMPHG